MRNIKLIIEYDGTGFVGWQAQDAGRTVQQTVEKALAGVLQEEVRLTVAGRTDTGVHAAGQAANFKTESRLPLTAIKNGANALLPDDVRVHAAREVPPEFNARYAARGKNYRYTILRRPSALKRHFGWYVKYRLDVKLMQAAARELPGEHDFRSFCVGKSEKPHYLCVIKNITWKVTRDEIRISVEGNRFLHNMVRIMVGTLVDIGRGRLQSDSIARILAAKDRKAAGQTAPALGLCLVKVSY
jgi:tRNA pseudouridine38-40 synthase